MANEVRTFTLNDDPGQVIEDLNAAFDGTTQTGLKAGDVKDSINGVALSEIFESDNKTVKKATTGPASSAGFFHFAHEAPFAGDFITNNLAIGTPSVGPTGSGATIIWTELDSLPDNVKGIRIGILLEMKSHPSNFITAGIKVRKYGSETTFSTIGYCCAGTILVKGENLYQPSCVVVDVPVDSNKRFQFYNFCQGPTSGYWPTCQVFLEGYYI